MEDKVLIYCFDKKSAGGGMLHSSGMVHTLYRLRFGDAISMVNALTDFNWGSCPSTTYLKNLVV